MHWQSQILSARPSATLGVTYPWAAIDLDKAVALFGRWVERQMDEAEHEIRQSGRQHGRGGGVAQIDPADIKEARTLALTRCLEGDVEKPAGTRRGSEVMRNIAMLQRMRGE